MRRPIVYIILIIEVLFSWNINAQYSEIKNGIYVNPESVGTPDEMMLKIKGDSLFVYKSMRSLYIIDGPGPIVNTDANIVAKCKLTPTGCGVYELSDTLYEHRIFKNMRVEQSGSLDEDSINVDIVFSKYKKSWIPFDVALIPWLDKKTVDSNSVVKFKLKPKASRFYIALLPKNGRPVTDWYYNQLGPMKYMYNKPIKVSGSQITVTIPNNVNGVFYELNVIGEYLREISPGLVKWRGQYYFFSPELTKKYLN